jgi:hypothetical protein
MTDPASPLQVIHQKELGDFWKRFSLPDSLPLDGGGRGWG